MIQRRRGPRFLGKALQALAIGRETFRQNFDGNGSIEPRIVRAIHLTHTARANQRLDFIRTKFGSGSKRHSRRDYNGCEARPVPTAIREEFVWGQLPSAVQVERSSKPPPIAPRGRSRQSPRTTPSHRARSERSGTAPLRLFRYAHRNPGTTARTYPDILRHGRRDTPHIPAPRASSATDLLKARDSPRSGSQPIVHWDARNSKPAIPP